MGGAMSAREIGLYDAVKKGNYNFIEREGLTDPESKRAATLAGYDADYFFQVQTP